MHASEKNTKTSVFRKARVFVGMSATSVKPPAAWTEEAIVEMIKASAGNSAQNMQIEVSDAVNQPPYGAPSLLAFSPHTH